MRHIGGSKTLISSLLAKTCLCRPRPLVLLRNQTVTVRRRNVVSTRFHLPSGRAQSNMSLQSRLAVRFVVALPLVWAVLFLPAGSLRFWQGWLYMTLFFSASIFLTIYFLRHDPQLLERRLETKEQVRGQRLFKGLWIPLWVCGLTIPGFDFRMGRSTVPIWLTLVSQALVLCAYFLMFLVLRVNSFASSIVRVEKEQRVISTGPYRLVRHLCILRF